MVRLFVAAVFVCLLFDPARSAGLDAAAINNADFRGKPPAEDKVDTAVVKGSNPARPRDVFSRGN